MLNIALGPYQETILILSLEIKLHSADNNKTFFLWGPRQRDNQNIFFTNNEESGAILIIIKEEVIPESWAAEEEVIPES